MDLAHARAGPPGLSEASGHRFAQQAGATQTREVHSHIHCALDTYRCFLCTRLGPYAHLPPLMRTSKSTLDLEVNHAVACVRIA